MDPITLALVASLGGAAMKGGLGISQLLSANKGLNSLQRPEYKMPGEINQIVGAARQQVQDPTAPGYNQEQNNIMLRQSNAMNVASESGNPMAMLGQILAQSNKAGNNLATQQQTYANRMQQQYNQALKTRAQFIDQQWQMNKYAPYIDKFRELRDVKGAGLQNINNSINNLSGIGSALASARMGGTGQTIAEPDYTGGGVG